MRARVCVCVCTKPDSVHKAAWVLPTPQQIGVVRSASVVAVGCESFVESFALQRARACAQGRGMCVG
jgi:hypothetical protein